jgi:hypothetical protein
MAPSRRSWPQWGLLTTFLFLAGCAEPDLHGAATAPALSFEELKQKISRVRGLPFQHEVSLETRGIEEIRALVEKSVAEEHGRESLEQFAGVLARLGLLTEPTDLTKALAELRFFKQPLHYDARGNRLIVPQGAIKPGLAFLASPWRPGSDAARQLLQAHALTHILQEQHFGWRERLKNSNTGDTALALRALMRGDAVLVGLAQLLGEAGENRQKVLDDVKEVFRFEAQINRDLAHLPKLLRRKASFQYVEGTQFVMWAYSLKGWEGVNGLYSYPPLSTTQILHPEKYYAQREDPVRIIPWGLLRQLRGRKIMDETLGELLIQILLSRTLSKQEAEQAAAGWAGDSFLAFQQGEEMVLAWTTAWENQEEAAEFFRSYRKALERGHGISLEAAGKETDTLKSPPRSSRPIFLQLRDNFVFFLDGISHPRSGELAEALWNELETDGEPQQRFEVVRPPRHPHSATR